MRIENGSTPNIVFVLVDATDDETKEPSPSPTTFISKNGQAWAATTNSATEIGGAGNGEGFYVVALTATETNTDGPLAIYASAAGTHIWRDVHEVATHNTTIAITTAQYNTMADHVWRRTAANIEASSDGDTLGFRSGYGMMATHVNNNYVSAATNYITKADDATVLGSRTVSTNASADPITGLDTV